MPAQRQTTTADELLALTSDQPCELVEGELRMMSPAGFDHGWIVSNIHRLLSQHVYRSRLGRVLAAETGFLLKRDPDTVLAPDVSFVRTERLPRRGHASYLPFAPDLAVEVSSPGHGHAELTAKARLWLELGAGEVWLIWPSMRTVEVYSPAATAPLRLGEADQLANRPIVPGFACAVSAFFE